jgi:hypothetical protein
VRAFFARGLRRCTITIPFRRSLTIRHAREITLAQRE